MRIAAPAHSTEHVPTRAPAGTPASAADAEMPHVPGVAHKYVTVNGVRYHYAEMGAGDPIVLIHGFPQNWYMWRKLMPDLARSYRVIALDMRGAGWSDAPAGGYEKEALADDVADVMRAVGITRARVMGHDWGGYVGFHLAMRHPNMVSHFVALNIATPWPSGKALPDMWRLLYQPPLAAPVLGAALLREPSFIKALLAGAGSRDPWTATDYAAFAAPYRDRTRAAAGSAMYRTFLTRELLPWMRGKHKATTLLAKTMVLLGAEDPVIRPHLIDGFSRYARDMRADVVPGAGHFLAEESPAEVLRRVEHFFRTEDTRRNTSARARR